MTVDQEGEETSKKKLLAIFEFLTPWFGWETIQKFSNPQLSEHMFKASPRQIW